MSQIKKENNQLLEQEKEKINIQNINSYLTMNQILSTDNNTSINKKSFYLLENKSKSSNKMPNLKPTLKEKNEKNDYKIKMAYSTNNIYYNLILGKNNYNNNESENTLEQLRQKLLYKENTNLENIKYLTDIKLNKKYNNIDIIKNILVNFVNDNQINFLFISDICNVYLK